MEHNAEPEFPMLFIKSMGREFSSIVHSDRLNPMFRIMCLQLNKLGHYFGKSVVMCR